MAICLSWVTESSKKHLIAEDSSVDKNLKSTSNPANLESEIPFCDIQDWQKFTLWYSPIRDSMLTNSSNSVFVLTTAWALSTR